MPTILIPCAGENKRWNDKIPSWDLAYPKALARVGDHSLLERIIRQIEALGWEGEIFVITRDRTIEIEAMRISRLLGDLRIGIRRPTHDRSIFISREILEARAIWGSYRTIVLLGDVVYGKKTIEAILGEPKPKERIRWWANHVEIFGMRFSEVAYPDFAKALEKVASHAERIGSLIESGGSAKAYGAMGKLWACYRQWSGFPIQTHKIDWGNGSIERVEDYTTDIDHRKDYDRLIANVVKPGKLEQP